MQRTRTIVDVYDDIDQNLPKPVDTPADQTVRLSLNQWSVELDLTDAHAKQLTDLVLPYLRVGRKIGPRGGTTRQHLAPSDELRAAHPEGLGAARRRNQRIDKWAKTQPRWKDIRKGYRPSEMLREYNEKHPEDAI